MAYMEFSGTAVSIARVPASPVRARGRLSGLAAFNYVLDLALIVAFLVDWNLRFTGLTVHEWLGIVLGGVMYEQAIEVNDKVPIIGNIPLIERRARMLQTRR